VINHEKADQDVTDEMTDKVYSRGEVMPSKKNVRWFLRKSWLEGEQEWRQMRIQYYTDVELGRK